MRFSIIFAALPALALAAPAPVLEPRAGAKVVPGKYIAVMKPNTVGILSTSLVSTVTKILGTALDAEVTVGSFKALTFSADSSKLASIQALASVDYIEPDQYVEASVLTQQNGATYGLHIISHKTSSGTTYIYDSSAGAGTFSYIIDTGILTTHPDFGSPSRAIFGANFAGGSNSDCNGHGTHVAGTTGSTTYGVAKKTTLIAVKVLGCDGSGTNSGVIQGIQWASNDVVSKGRQGKAVGNMSLGGGYSAATNQAVAAAVSNGLFMAVAAGNDGADAANSSPASERTACTVGAIDSSRTEASFSNYGSILDVFAPGVNTLSTWNDGQTKIISGTSMATPHVTGLGAYLLALEGPRSGTELCARIVALAQSGVKGLKGASPNKIAYNGNGA